MSLRLFSSTGNLLHIRRVVMTVDEVPQDGSHKWLIYRSESHRLIDQLNNAVSFPFQDTVDASIVSLTAQLDQNWKAEE